MSKARVIGAGACIGRANGGGGYNTGGNQGGGDALEGLVSTTNMRVTLVPYVRTRADGGNARNWVFCMNQLGGVGRRWGQAAGPGNRGGVHAQCKTHAARSRELYPRQSKQSSGYGNPDVFRALSSRRRAAAPASRVKWYTSTSVPWNTPIVHATNCLPSGDGYGVSCGTCVSAIPMGRAVEFIYYGSSDGLIHEVNLATGEEVWSGPPTAAPTVAAVSYLMWESTPDLNFSRGNLLFGTEDGVVGSLGVDFDPFPPSSAPPPLRINWSHDMRNSLTAMMQIPMPQPPPDSTQPKHRPWLAVGSVDAVGRKAYLTVLDGGEVFSEPLAGTVIWRNEVEEPPQGSMAYSGSSWASTGEVFIYYSTSVAASGTVAQAAVYRYQVWPQDTAPRNWHSLLGVASTPATGVVLGGNESDALDKRLLYGSYGSTVYAVNAEYGLEAWETPSGTISDTVQSTPVLSPDGANLYVVARDGCVYALEAGNGALLWKAKVSTTTPHSSCGGKLPLPPSSPVQTPDGTVWCGTVDGAVCGIDANNGELLSRVELPGARAGMYVSTPALSPYAGCTGSRESWDQVTVEDVSCLYVSTSSCNQLGVRKPGTIAAIKWPNVCDPSNPGIAPANVCSACTKAFPDQEACNTCVKENCRADPS